MRPMVEQMPVERPRLADHGDYSTNVAMQVAKKAGVNPRDLATWLAAALGIVAGFPAVIAVLVALKGIGRFTELATPAARERFIVGTLASLLWACAVAGVIRLAIW